MAGFHVFSVLSALDGGDHPNSAHFGFMSADYSEGRFGRQDVLELQERDPKAALLETRLFPKRPRFRLLVLMALREAASGQAAAAADLIAEAAGLGDVALPETDGGFMRAAVASLLEAGCLDGARLLITAFKPETAVREAVRAARELDSKLQEILLLSAVDWAGSAARKDALPQLELFKRLVEAASHIELPQRRELVFTALEARADDFKGLMQQAIETQDTIAYSLATMIAGDQAEGGGWSTGIGAPEAARAHVGAARARSGDEQRGLAQIDEAIANCNQQGVEAAALAEIARAIRAIASDSTDRMWRLLGVAVEHDPAKSLGAILAALADDSGGPGLLEAVDAIASTADAISPRLGAALRRPLAVAYARAGAGAQARDRGSSLTLPAGQLRVIGLNPLVAVSEKLALFRKQAELAVLSGGRDRHWARPWLRRMAAWAGRLDSDERRARELAAIAGLSEQLRERSGFDAVLDAAEAVTDQDLRADVLGAVVKGAEMLPGGERSALRARALQGARVLAHDPRRKVLVRWLETITAQERGNAEALLGEREQVEREQPPADLLGRIAGLFAGSGEWSRAEELWYAAALADKGDTEAPALFVARATAAARGTDEGAWEEALRRISSSNRQLVEALAVACENPVRLARLERRVRKIPWAAVPIARAWVRLGDAGRGARILLKRSRIDEEFAELCELGRLTAAHRLGRVLLIKLIPHAYTGQTGVDRFGLLADTFSSLPGDWSKEAYRQLHLAAGESDFISGWRKVEARAAIASAVCRNGHADSARALIERIKKIDLPKNGKVDLNEALLQPHARASALLRLASALRELHLAEPRPALLAEARGTWRNGLKSAAEVSSEFFRGEAASLVVKAWVEARRWGWAEADEALELAEEIASSMAASTVSPGHGYRALARGHAELGEPGRALSVAARIGGGARDDVLVELAGKTAGRDLRDAGRYFEMLASGEGRSKAARAIAHGAFRLEGRAADPRSAAPARWSAGSSAWSSILGAVVLVLATPAVLYWTAFREFHRLRNGLAGPSRSWWLVGLFLSMGFAVRALMRLLRKEVRNPAARFAVSLLAVPLAPMIAPLYLFVERYLPSRPAFRATAFAFRKRLGGRLRAGGERPRPLSQQPTFSRREDLGDVVWLASGEAEPFDILFGSLLASVPDSSVLARTLETLPPLSVPAEKVQRQRRRRAAPGDIRVSHFGVESGGVTERREVLSARRGIRRMGRTLIAAVLTAGLAVTGVALIPLKVARVVQGRRRARRGAELARQGGAVLAQARPAEALPLLDGATRLLPDNPAVWNDYAVALSQLGRTEEAIEAHRTATAKAVGTPVLAHAWFNYGYTLHQAGRYREGVEAFDRALARLLPGSPEREQAKLGRDLCREMLQGNREGRTR